MGGEGKGDAAVRMLNKLYIKKKRDFHSPK